MFNPYEYFKGKNVLLIGNGEKISQIDYSKYNSIIRMNLGVEDKPCDVWINNLVHEGHIKLKSIPDINYIVRLNFENDGKRAERMPDWVKQKTWLWNKEEFSLMTKRYNYPRPTTGFISIYWLMNYCNCTITITAFDFFKTRNRYTMEQRNGNPLTYVHDVKLEEEVITKLIQRGLINAI